jgi:ferrochelatase
MRNGGVLLVNIGSPASPAVGDVRGYLREFLMDRRVLDMPWPVRTAIVYLGILPWRFRRAAEAYQKVWTPEGAPLVVISRRVQVALGQRLSVPTELAMRYGQPSISAAVRRLCAHGIDDLLLIPMFPHYARASYETAVVRAREVIARQAPRMRLTVQPPFYDQPDHLAALVASLRPSLEAGYDHLLFSFHGLPERQLRKADPTRRHCLRRPDCCERDSPAQATCYRAQCLRTAEATAAQAGVANGRWSVAFQSRFGGGSWLKPYTGAEVQRLAQGGIRRLIVICPAFVVDCLETLEEIGLRTRADFRAAGGGELVAVPCLNDQPRWLEALERMARAFLES